MASEDGLVNILANSRIDFRRGFKNNGTAVFRWIRTSPQNYYSKFLNKLRRKLKNKTTFKYLNIDLPWFGKNLFSKNKNYKIAVIAQDAMKRNAKVGAHALNGSITFWAHLTNHPKINTKIDFNKITNNLTDGNGRRGFGYSSWQRIQQIIKALGQDNVYLTDASKCFIKKDEKYKRETIPSKELLIKELIEIKPEKILVLGRDAFELLDLRKTYNKNLTDYAIDNKTICCDLNGKKTPCMISFFPGRANSRYKPEYHEKLLTNLDKFCKG